MTLKEYCRQATALYDELTSLLRDLHRVTVVV
jgi:hypothetical protein